MKARRNYDSSLMSQTNGKVRERQHQKSTRIGLKNVSLSNAQRPWRGFLKMLDVSDPEKFPTPRVLIACRYIWWKLRQLKVKKPLVDFFIKTIFDRNECKIPYVCLTFIFYQKYRFKVFYFHVTTWDRIVFKTLSKIFDENFWQISKIVLHKCLTGS